VFFVRPHLRAGYLGGRGFPTVVPRERPLECRAAGGGVRVEIGEYRGVVRISRRVFQRLCRRGASRGTISREPASRASPSGSRARACWP